MATVSTRAEPNGYQLLEDLDTAQALTVPRGTRYALMLPEGGSVRWRDDETDPTASVGTPIQVLQPFEYDSRLDLFRVIAQVPGAGTTLHVTYYR